MTTAGDSTVRIHSSPALTGPLRSTSAVVAVAVSVANVPDGVTAVVARKPLGFVITSVALVAEAE